MLLYELGVEAAARGRGIGTTLVNHLRDLAHHTGCRGMWVVTEAGNEAAIRTYRAADAIDRDAPVIMESVFNEAASE